LRATLEIFQRTVLNFNFLKNLITKDQPYTNILDRCLIIFNQLKVYADILESHAMHDAILKYD